MARRHLTVGRLGKRHGRILLRPPIQISLLSFFPYAERCTIQAVDRPTGTILHGHFQGDARDVDLEDSLVSVCGAKYKQCRRHE